MFRERCGVSYKIQNELISNVFYMLFNRVEGEERQGWITLIKAHQTIHDKTAVFICDLHFNESDLNRTGPKARLKKNAMPQLGNRLHERTSTTSCNEDSDCSTRDGTTQNNVTISNEIYKRLVDASVEVLRLENTVKKKNSLIAKKDAEIEKLKASIEKEKNYLANLSPVSKYCLV